MSSAKRFFKSMTAYKAAALLLACVLALSSFMAGTMAWTSIHQSAMNEARAASREERTDFPVRLEKYEKLADGTETGVPLPGAEFYLYTEDGEQIGGRHVTDDEGYIDVLLPPGSYYFEETNPPAGYTYDTDADGEIRRYYFDVTGEEVEVVVVTAYNRPATGGLAITKTVENEGGGALTQEQRGTAFEFTVTFSDGGTYAYRIDGGAEWVLESGGTLTLQHGQRAVFEGIPVGVVYTVTETPAPGYAARSENHQGTVTAGGSTAAFTNTAPSGSLTITKTVSGAGADFTKEFEFTAVIGDETYIFSLRHGESRTFDHIPIGTPYTVTEADYTAQGYITTPSTGSYDGFVDSGNQALPFVNTYDDGTGGPGSLRITKTVAGPDANLTKKFDFTVAFSDLPDEPVEILINGEPAELSAERHVFIFALAHGESVLIENLPAGVRYTVEETRGDEYRTSVRLNGSVIIANRIAGVISSGYDEEVTFINARKPEIRDFSLNVRKTVEGNVPAEQEGTVFRFILEVEGRAPEAFTLEAGESIGFTVPAGAAYTIREVDLPAGWSLVRVVNGSGTATGAIAAAFTNRYTVPETVDIEGEKTWEYGDEAVTLPASITIRLKNGDTVVEIKTVRPGADGRWRYAFTGLPKYDGSGGEITYTIEEIPAGSWKASYHGCDVINTYMPPAVAESIPVEKAVTGGTPASPARFHFTLAALDGAPMPGGSVNGVKTVAIVGAGATDFGSIAYHAPGTYVYTITELNTGEEGYAYDKSVYTLTVEVKEQGGKLVIASRTLARNGSPAAKAVFSNEYKPGQTSVRVTKVWLDNNNPGRPRSVQAQLYKDGSPYGDPVILNAANGWAYTWDGLEKSPNYTVDEINVPSGYAKAVTGSAAAGFIVTNSKNTPPPELIIITGRKTWDHGTNPESKRPQMIILYVKADGEIILQKQITAADQWNWTIRVDKYAVDGHEIVYTVDEQKIAGYTKTVNGFHLHNAYTPGSDSPGKPDRNGPKTDDTGNLALWLTLMAVTASGLAAIIIFNRRRKRGTTKKRRS